MLYAFSANILLGTHYEAKISDFGLARVATGSSSGAARFTNVTRDELADVYGSLAYLPHDFVTNGCKYNVKTDVFSFGVVRSTLFFLCPDSVNFTSLNKFKKSILSVVLNDHLMCLNVSY